MTNSFSRTIRSMNHDRFEPGLILILLIGAVLLLWLGWFFWGDLPVYETSRDVQIQSDGTLLAAFPEAIREQLHPGQKAVLFFPGKNGKVQQVEAEVLSIPVRSNDPVEFFLYSDTLPAETGQGELKILVETISPAELVWQGIEE